MSEEPAVRVENLWKRFGFRRALRGVDLEVSAGSCFALFGHNGAGKSTLLRILATRTQPTSGRVEVAGHDVRQAPVEARRTVGVVFHEHCLRNDLTLAENLRFYAGLYELDDYGGRVDELLALLGLAGRRHDPVRTFSQGMLKRATLVRSLLHDPKVWLLDEPFSGLDVEGRTLLERTITAERDAGRTIVMITHDLEQGLRMADDAVMFVDGEIVSRGCADVREAMRDRVPSAGSGGGGAAAAAGRAS